MSRSLAEVLTVALAGLLGYAGTLAYDFVWDDTLLIQRSYQLHQWSALPALLGSHFWAEVQETSHYYRPFVTLTFFLDVQLWGLNPLGFHLTNLLAHLSASLALLALGRRLAGGDLAAPIAGVLFALHPLHTESVAFISGRTDVLAGLFVLLSLLAYAGWRDTGRPALCAASLVAFFAALTSKEVAVTLPLLLALYDWARRGEDASLEDGDRGRGAGRDAAPASSAQALRRYAPYASVLALYVAIRVWALGGMVDAGGGAWGSLLVRVLTTLKVVAWYAWMTLVPYTANPYYQIVPVRLPPDGVWWLAMGLLTVLAGLTLLAGRTSRTVGFGALWFWITLIPFAGVNVLPLSTAIMAERFLYLPTAGFCLVLGVGFSRALGARAPVRGRQLSPLPAAGLGVVVVAYALLTLWRNEDWKDDYRLYLRMVETSPDTALPRVNLAFTQMPRGEVAAANAHLTRAVEIMPNNARALVGLGLTETVLGRREAGLQHALRALALEPGNPNVLATLGAVYLYREEPAQALGHLEHSLRINPNQVHASLNLALGLVKVGRQEEAEVALARAVALARLMSPDNALVDRVTAEVYAATDRGRAAAAWQRYIARLRGLGELSFAQQGDLAYALRQLARLRESAR